MIQQIARVLAFIIFAVPYTASAAEVSFFMGNVSLMRTGKKYPVRVASQLQSGDVIRTGANSLIEIRYKNSSMIKINEKSTATIGSGKMAVSDNVSLINGTMTGSLRKLIKGSAKTYTPTTICAIRGTEYTVTVSAGGDTRVDVSEGRVEIINPYGASAVDRNKAAESRAGEKPALSVTARDEWKKTSDREFETSPVSAAERCERHLDALDARSRETERSLPDVRSAITGADSEESIEKAGSLLEGTTVKAEDDLFMTEALNFSARESASSLREKDPAAGSRYATLESKAGGVAEQQRSNLRALDAIREEYRKARDRIMSRYKNKIDEIKSKFKNKKSDI